MDIAAKFTTLFVDMILPLMVGYGLRRIAWSFEKEFFIGRYYRYRGFVSDNDCVQYLGLGSGV